MLHAPLWLSETTVLLRAKVACKYQRFTGFIGKKGWNGSEEARERPKRDRLPKRVIRPTMELDVRTAVTGDGQSLTVVISTRVSCVLTPTDRDGRKSPTAGRCEYGAVYPLRSLRSWFGFRWLGLVYCAHQIGVILDFFG